MTPIFSNEDLIQRASRLPLPDAQRLAKLWKTGECAVVIQEVEDRVPEPVSAHGQTVH
jgi:hypothetical protein